jgi:hypothetical protein
MPDLNEAVEACSHLMIREEPTRGDAAAGKVEAKNDGGRSPHEIKFGQLVFEWVVDHNLAAGT